MILTILGRRWWQKSSGKTHHTATILIDGKMWGKTKPSYGFGSNYIETAFAILERANVLPMPRERFDSSSHESTWLWAGRTGTTLYTECVDVAREKDL